MIAVTLQGRLGNQMFQYAYYHELREKNRIVLLIERNYKNELFYFSGFSKVKFLIDKIIFYFLHRYFQHTLIQTGMEDPKNVIVNPDEHTLISGYFQSLKYFPLSKAKILDKFQIKEKYKREYLAFSRQYLQLKKPIVAIHIRRTDYLNNNFNNLIEKIEMLTLEYFKAIIKKYNSKNYQVVICSDDIEPLKLFFNDEQIIYCNNSSIVDFQILLNSDILVMSNSSFSWWAAFLNSNRPVHCPANWLGRDGNGNIFPRDILYSCHYIFEEPQSIQ